MDDASLRRLRLERYNELLRDPDTLKVMMRMTNATTDLDLLHCVFPDKYTVVLETVSGTPDNTSGNSLSEIMAIALREAIEVGFPLSALPEGLSRTFEDAFGGELIRPDTRPYDKVVAGLSPPQHSTVLPFDSSQWPKNIGPIEYVYAGAETFVQAEEDLDGVAHYTSLLRQLVTQPVTSARRSRTLQNGAKPFVCVLNESEPRAFTVSQSKQDLLRALSESPTAAGFYLTLLRDGQCPDSVPIVNYWASEARSVGLNERIEAKLVSQLFNLWGGRSYINPDMIGQPKLDADLQPKTDDESDDGRDGEADKPSEGGEDGYHSEAGDECSCGECDATDILPRAFSRGGRLRHEMILYPPGGVGCRDMTHVGAVPMAYRHLARELNSIAATCLCDEMKQPTETASSIENQIKLAESMNSATKRVEQLWNDLEDDLGEAMERGMQQVQNAESERASVSASGQQSSTPPRPMSLSDGSPVMVLQGLHPNDNDRHTDVISFLTSMSQKMLNGWQAACVARLDLFGGVFDEMRSATQDKKDTSSESIKRGMPSGDGSEDRESKRTKTNS